MFSKQKKRSREEVAAELRKALKTPYQQVTPQEKMRAEQMAQRAAHASEEAHKQISGSFETKMSGNMQAHADRIEAKERYIFFLDRIEKGRKDAEANKSNPEKAGKYFTTLRSEYMRDPHLSDGDKESLERTVGIVTRTAQIPEYHHDQAAAKKPGSVAFDSHAAHRSITYGQVLAAKHDDHEANKQFEMVVSYIRSKYSEELSKGDKASLSKEDRNVLESLQEVAGRLADETKDRFARSEYQAAVNVATTLLKEGHDIPGYSRHAKK